MTAPRSPRDAVPPSPPGPEPDPPEWFRRAARRQAQDQLHPALTRPPARTGQPPWIGAAQPAFYPGTEDATMLIQRITDEAVPDRVFEGGRHSAEQPARTGTTLGPGSAGSAAPAAPAGSAGSDGAADRTALIARPVAAAGGPDSAVEQVDPVDAVTGMKTAKTSGVVRAGALMAVATVVSRISGLLAKIVLAAALGATAINNSYSLANTLPNIVFELLIGGVLTSVAIPLLTRAQRSDPDGGMEYTQRLMTLVFVGLIGATALSVLLAPLLTRLYLSSSDSVDSALATQLARLLLPQIFFYGVAAMFGAVLNTKERFAANAWAPVVNNLVVIGVAVLLLRSDIDATAGTLNPRDTLLLGVGTTLGIVAQAAVMLPSLRRSGFRFRWRWGWDPRLTEAGGLVGWAIVYVLVSQVGVVVTTRIASGGQLAGGVFVFQTASLLFQMPYGILGVAVLTAIMPRMSRHAAAGQMELVKDDMSLANRLSAVALLPVSAGLIVIGSAVAFLLFRHGQLDADSALLIGGTLGGLAIGLVPLAMTLVQMRVFYAMKDGRTPTVINAIMVAVRVPLLIAAAQLDPDYIIPGLALATAVSYLVGAVVGEVWLRARFGPMGTRRTLVTIGKMTVASAVGGAAALFVTRATVGILPTDFVDALRICLVAGLVGIVVIAGMALLLRVEELTPLRNRILRMLGFRTGPRTAAAMGGSVGVPGPTGSPPGGPTGGPPRSQAPPSPPSPPSPAFPADRTSREQVTRRVTTTPGSPPGPAVPTADPALTGATEILRADSGGVDSGGVDSGGVDATVTVGAATLRPHPVTLSPGATVGGRYRLVSLVGSDAAGNRFWRARDTVLPRDMAVTLLPDTNAASATVARTLRVGRLHHLGLPQTLDVGTEHGQSYIVGQWVDGATLTDLLAGGPLEPDVATSITAKVSEAVAEAHRNGIALGAINPALIRVNFDGQVRLSHVIAHGNATPDQDIRAVGALLYLMLTGTWPLPVETAADAATSQALLPGGADPTVRFGSSSGSVLPPAPSRLGREVPADEVRPGVPEALSALAARALHPDDPSGIHAVGAIAALLRQPDVAAAPAAPPAAAEQVSALSPAERRLVRERRIKLSIAAVMLAAFAALIVIVVASLSKQFLGAVQDPNVTDVAGTGRPGLVTTAPAVPGGTPSSKPSAGTSPSPDRTATSATSSSASPSTSASASSAGLPAAPVPITGATVYDPQGDGNKDNTGQVQRVFDGDPTSAWQTFIYNQQFPTIKAGVGLTLQLAKPVTPTSVKVSSDTPNTKVEIRTATGPDMPLAQTKVIGSGTITGTSVTIPVTAAPKSSYLIVFVTQLAPANQKFQSDISEITVSGN